MVHTYRSCTVSYLRVRPSAGLASGLGASRLGHPPDAFPGGGKLPVTKFQFLASFFLYVKNEYVLCNGRPRVEVQHLHGRVHLQTADVLARKKSTESC